MKKMILTIAIICFSSLLLNTGFVTAGAYEDRNAEQGQKALHSIDDLPELPLEALSLGGELGPAKTEPVITILPKEFVEPDKPTLPSDPKVTPHVDLPGRVVTHYWTRVTYPRVICHPPSALTDQVVKRVLQKQEKSDRRETSESKADQPQMRYYKLSNYQSKKLIINKPWFCTVHGGPWMATVVATQRCDGSGTDWRLEVSGLPELYMTWSGVWEDIPSGIYPNLGIFLDELHFEEKTSECCPGFDKCYATNSCIPVTVPCGPPEF